MAGVRIEPVSLGKGFVAYRVHFPTLKRRRREIAREYPRVNEACTAVKTFCRREECDPETAALVEKHCPAESWGSGL